MKLERLHESVLPSIALLSGLTLAIVAGNLAGSGKTGMVGALIGGIIAMSFFLMIRQRVWMLIPATWMLGGKISVLPLPFSVAHLGILFAFGTFLLLKAFKIIRLKPKLGLVEVWMFANLAYLVTVFLRNPVGVEALGADRVGGRPYFDIFIAFLGFWVLSRAVASTRDAFFLPLLVIAGNFFHATINVIANHFPSTIGPLSRLYSGIAAAENLDALPALPGEGTDRQGHLAGLGSSIWLFACSRWRPATLLNPLFFGRFLIFLFAAYAVLLSGFRSFLFGMMLTFMIGTYFHRGMVETVKAGMIGLVALTLLISLQGTIIDLPLSAQRALSFLPGNWDYAAKSEAKGSTEWRVEMWKAMLTGNKYIANKWLGDGFGFTRHQLQVMNANALTRSSADQQENLMIGGGVHSGPISSIRYVGIVGLIIFVALLVLVLMRAFRLIHRAAGTPYYALALFIGIPAIYHPLSFLFIFGAFEGDLPHAIITIGMQKMLENSLDAYEASRKEAPAPVEARPKIHLRRPEYAPAGRLG